MLQRRSRDPVPCFEIRRQRFRDLLLQLFLVRHDTDFAPRSRKLNRGPERLRTLYLRDIERLEGEAIAALPRALANQELLAIDGGDPLRVRLVASADTEEELSRELLAIFGERILRMAPLSHRLEDLGLLISRFLNESAAPKKLTFRRSVARALALFDWPGEVRELETTIAHGVSLSGEDNVVRLIHLPRSIQVSESRARERRSLLHCLEETGGNVSEVARMLRVSRAQVHRLANRYGLDVSSFAKELN